MEQSNNEVVIGKITEISGKVLIYSDKGKGTARVAEVGDVILSTDIVDDSDGSYKLEIIKPVKFLQNEDLYQSVDLIRDEQNQKSKENENKLEQNQKVQDNKEFDNNVILDRKVNQKDERPKEDSQKSQKELEEIQEETHIRRNVIEDKNESLLSPAQGQEVDKIAPEKVIDAEKKLQELDSDLDNLKLKMPKTSNLNVPEDDGGGKFLNIQPGQHKVDINFNKNASKEVGKNAIADANVSSTDKETVQRIRTGELLTPSVENELTGVKITKSDPVKIKEEEKYEEGTPESFKTTIPERPITPSAGNGGSGGSGGSGGGGGNPGTPPIQLPIEEYPFDGPNGGPDGPGPYDPGPYDPGPNPPSGPYPPQPYTPPNEPNNPGGPVSTGPDVPGLLLPESGMYKELVAGKLGISDEASITENLYYQIKDNDYGIALNLYPVINQLLDSADSNTLSITIPSTVNLYLLPYAGYVTEANYTKTVNEDGTVTISIDKTTLNTLHDAAIQNLTEINSNLLSLTSTINDFLLLKSQVGSFSNINDIQTNIEDIKSTLKSSVLDPDTSNIVKTFNTNAYRELITLGSVFENQNDTLSSRVLAKIDELLSSRVEEYNQAVSLRDITIDCVVESRLVLYSKSDADITYSINLDGATPYVLDGTVSLDAVADGIKMGSNNVPTGEVTASIEHILKSDPDSDEVKIIFNVNVTFIDSSDTESHIITIPLPASVSTLNLTTNSLPDGWTYSNGSLIREAVSGVTGLDETLSITCLKSDFSSITTDTVTFPVKFISTDTPIVGDANDITSNNELTQEVTTSDETLNNVIMVKELETGDSAKWTTADINELMTGRQVSTIDVSAELTQLKAEKDFLDTIYTNKTANNYTTALKLLFDSSSITVSFSSSTAKAITDVTNAGFNVSGNNYKLTGTALKNFYDAWSADDSKHDIYIGESAEHKSDDFTVSVTGEVNKTEFSILATSTVAVDAIAEGIATAAPTINYVPASVRASVENIEIPVRVQFTPKDTDSSEDFRITLELTDIELDNASFADMNFSIIGWDNTALSNATWETTYDANTHKTTIVTDISGAYINSQESKSFDETVRFKFDRLSESDKALLENLETSVLMPITVKVQSYETAQADNIEFDTSDNSSAVAENTITINLAEDIPDGPNLINDFFIKEVQHDNDALTDNESVSLDFGSIINLSGKTPGSITVQLATNSEDDISPDVDITEMKLIWISNGASNEVNFDGADTFTLTGDSLANWILAGKPDLQLVATKYVSGTYNIASASVTYTDTSVGTMYTDKQVNIDAVASGMDEKVQLSEPTLWKSGKDAYFSMKITGDFKDEDSSEDHKIEIILPDKVGSYSLKELGSDRIWDLLERLEIGLANKTQTVKYVDASDDGFVLDNGIKFSYSETVQGTETIRKIIIENIGNSIDETIYLRTNSDILEKITTFNPAFRVATYVEENASNILSFDNTDDNKLQTSYESIQVSVENTPSISLVELQSDPNQLTIDNIQSLANVGQIKSIDITDFIASLNGNSNNASVVIRVNGTGATGVTVKDHAGNTIGTTADGEFTLNGTLLADYLSSSNKNIYVLPKQYADADFTLTVTGFNSGVATPVVNFMPVIVSAMAEGVNSSKANSILAELIISKNTSGANSNELNNLAELKITYDINTADVLDKSQTNTLVINLRNVLGLHSGDYSNMTTGELNGQGKSYLNYIIQDLTLDLNQLQWIFDTDSNGDYTGYLIYKIPANSVVTSFEDSFSILNLDLDKIANNLSTVVSISNSDVTLSVNAVDNDNGTTITGNTLASTALINLQSVTIYENQGDGSSESAYSLDINDTLTALQADLLAFKNAGGTYQGYFDGRADLSISVVGIKTGTVINVPIIGDKTITNGVLEISGEELKDLYSAWDQASTDEQKSTISHVNMRQELYNNDSFVVRVNYTDSDGTVHVGDPTKVNVNPISTTDSTVTFDANITYVLVDDNDPSQGFTNKAILNIKLADFDLKDIDGSEKHTITISLGDSLNNLGYEILGNSLWKKVGDNLVYGGDNVVTNISEELLNNPDFANIKLVFDRNGLFGVFDNIEGVLEESVAEISDQITIKIDNQEINSVGNSISPLGSTIDNDNIIKYGNHITMFENQSSAIIANDASSHLKYVSDDSEINTITRSTTLSLKGTLEALDASLATYLAGDQARTLSSFFDNTGIKLNLNLKGMADNTGITVPGIQISSETTKLNGLGIAAELLKIKNLIIASGLDPVSGAETYFNAHTTALNVGLEGIADDINISFANVKVGETGELAEFTVRDGSVFIGSDYILKLYEAWAGSISYSDPANKPMLYITDVTPSGLVTQNGLIELTTDKLQSLYSYWKDHNKGDLDLTITPKQNSSNDFIMQTTLEINSSADPIYSSATTFVTVTPLASGINIDASYLTVDNVADDINYGPNDVQVGELGFLRLTAHIVYTDNSDIGKEIIIRVPNKNDLTFNYNQLNDDWIYDAAGDNGNGVIKYVGNFTQNSNTGIIVIDSTINLTFSTVQLAEYIRDKGLGTNKINASNILTESFVLQATSTDVDTYKVQELTPLIPNIAVYNIGFSNLSELPYAAITQKDYTVDISDVFVAIKYNDEGITNNQTFTLTVNNLTNADSTLSGQFVYIPGLNQYKSFRYSDDTDTATFNLNSTELKSWYDYWDELSDEQKLDAAKLVILKASSWVDCNGEEPDATITVTLTNSDATGNYSNPSIVEENVPDVPVYNSGSDVDNYKENAIEYSLDKVMQAIYNALLANGGLDLDSGTYNGSINPTVLNNILTEGIGGTEASNLIFQFFSKDGVSSTKQQPTIIFFDERYDRALGSDNYTVLKDNLIKASHLRELFTRWFAEQRDYENGNSEEEPSYNIYIIPSGDATTDNINNDLDFKFSVVLSMKSYTEDSSASEVITIDNAIPVIVTKDKASGVGGSGVYPASIDSIINVTNTIQAEKSAMYLQDKYSYSGPRESDLTAKFTLNLSTLGLAQSILDVDENAKMTTIYVKLPNLTASTYKDHISLSGSSNWKLGEFESYVAAVWTCEAGADIKTLANQNLEFTVDGVALKKLTLSDDVSLKIQINYSSDVQEDLSLSTESMGDHTSTELATGFQEALNELKAYAKFDKLSEDPDLSGTYQGVLLEASDNGGGTLKGNSQQDILIGRAGNDTISGEAGSDVIWAGGGNNTISGGSGNDVIYANNGTNDWAASNVRQSIALPSTETAKANYTATGSLGSKIQYTVNENQDLSLNAYYMKTVDHGDQIYAGKFHFTVYLKDSGWLSHNGNIYQGDHQYLVEEEDPDNSIIWGATGDRIGVTYYEGTLGNTTLSEGTINGIQQFINAGKLSFVDADAQGCTDFTEVIRSDLDWSDGYIIGTNISGIYALPSGDQYERKYLSILNIKGSIDLFESSEWDPYRHLFVENNVDYSSYKGGDQALNYAALRTYDYQLTNELLNSTNIGTNHDIIYAGTGSDRIYGGANGNIIYLTSENTIPNDTPSTTSDSDADIITYDKTDYTTVFDLVYGFANNDKLDLSQLLDEIAPNKTVAQRMAMVKVVQATTENPLDTDNPTAVTDASSAAIFVEDGGSKYKLAILDGVAWSVVNSDAWKADHIIVSSNSATDQDYMG